MSFTRKIRRNIQKNALKELGYIRPNKLAWHRSHGLDIDKVTHKYLNSLKKRRGTV